MFSSEWKFAGSCNHRLLAFAMAVVFVSFLPLQPIMAATTWTVTVTYDQTSGFHYKVTPNNQDCHYAGTALPLDPDTFKVCANDTVQFVAATPHKHDELLVVIPDAILDDDGLFPKHTQHFHVSDGETTKGGKVTGTPDGTTQHKYFLLVVVKDSGAIHCWDPKIIIGT